MGRNDAADMIYYENTGTRTQPRYARREGAANPLNGLRCGTDCFLSCFDADRDGDIEYARLLSSPAASPMVL